ALDFSAFFVVVPGCNLERSELVACREELGSFMEGIEPGLSALVMNLAIGAEQGLRVIETFISHSREGTAGGFCGCIESVEGSELLVKSISGIDVHPLEGAAGKALLQSLLTAKEQQIARGQRRQHARPVDEKLRHTKHENYGLSIHVQVGRRRNK